MQNVKYPLVYTKVTLRNWHSFLKLGVHEIYAPTMPYSRVKLDCPVDIGDYRHPRGPAQPIGLHMVYVPVSPNQGLDARAQVRAGRAKLYAMSFEQFEAMTGDQLQRTPEPGGFDHQRDLMETAVNRWPHGYAGFWNALYDEDLDAAEAIIVQARQPLGHVNIANSDAAWDAYMHAAIDEAWRAVGELA